MVSPIFNSDPQQSMVHQPSSPPPCNDFGGQPYQPDNGERRNQGFDGEAYRAFMRGLG